MDDADKHAKPTLLERLTALLTREPEDREELKDLLRGAFERRLLDADALSMIEGVLSVSEMTVRDIMIPRAQMDCVSIDDAPGEFIPVVIETKHSRFPVIGESKDDVVGILLAKELLNYYAKPDGFVLRDTLRPAVFVPESKRLNVLLREFRANRNHIAIVVDEYGGVSGLVTIEDVLEQIVGDIEDEYDFDESEDNFIAEGNGRWRVKAPGRDRGLQRALRHRATPTTRSTPSAASSCTPSGACPSAASRRSSTGTRSAWCARTAGACTRSRSSASTRATRASPRRHERGPPTRRPRRAAAPAPPRSRSPRWPARSPSSASRRSASRPCRWSPSACSPGCGSARAGARDGAWLGFAFGLGLFGVGVSWLTIALRDLRRACPRRSR